ncbi:MAG: DUF2239 family protein [Wenzhouxiangellaceae bacterium]
MSSDPSESSSCTAFAGQKIIARGSLAEIEPTIRNRADAQSVLVFDDATGRRIDLDFSTAASTPASAAASTVDDSRQPRRGRPRLGVVSREVTLLPRHWQWLNAQSGGASVTLRKLVERARREQTEAGQVRQAQEHAYRFIAAIAGDEPGFEEAARSLFKADRNAFADAAWLWPEDVRAYAMELAAAAFQSSADA